MPTLRDDFSSNSHPALGLRHPLRLVSELPKKAGMERFIADPVKSFGWISAGHPRTAPSLVRVRRDDNLLHTTQGRSADGTIHR
jgi:hypothetical protein